jgi:hypothetical protein
MMEKGEKPRKSKIAEKQPEHKILWSGPFYASR